MSDLKIFLFSLVLFPISVCAQLESLDSEARRYEAAFGAGNYSEAYRGFKELLVDKNFDSPRIAHYISLTHRALQNLHRLSELDDLLEEIARQKVDNWRALLAVSQVYYASNHYGYLISGKYERGYHRGGGKQVSSADRDRVRALQLIVGAEKLLLQDPSSGDLGNIYLEMARMLLPINGEKYWQLQKLTDLERLPEDYEEGGYWGRFWGFPGSSAGAPVDSDGEPLFYDLPESFELAKNDGERWRWALRRAEELSSGNKYEALLRRAKILRQQFGVQTLASYDVYFRGPLDEREDERKSIFSLHSLSESETLAKLANGVRRFSLPEDDNYISLYRELTKGSSYYKQAAYRALSEIFKNRRQYKKAAAVLKEYLAQGDFSSLAYREQFRASLAQIVGAWGAFEPAGAGSSEGQPSLYYRFRNGRSVTFEAYSLDLEKFVEDLKEHLSSNPRNLDWRATNISEIGYRIVAENKTSYLKEKVASWTQGLKPRPAHFDKRIAIDVPPRSI